MCDPQSLDVSAISWWTKLPCIANMVIQLIYPGLIRVCNLKKRECICRHRNSKSFRVGVLEQDLIFNCRIHSDLRQYIFHLRLLFWSIAITNTTLRLPGSWLVWCHLFVCLWLFLWPTTGPSPGKDLKKSKLRSKIYFYFNSLFCESLNEPGASLFTSWLYAGPLVS